MQIISKYFADLSINQIDQFSRLFDLYNHWNNQINVISRKDIENLYEHHVLHSLAIAKVIDFVPNSKILDVGTGGGFPGIPLAIMFPDVKFHLVDSIGKKIKVVNAIASELQITNIAATQERVEEVKVKFDFVLSRALTTFPEFYKMVQKNLSHKCINPLPNGIFYLKGGDLQSEVRPFKKNIVIYDIKSFFEESFFETKKIVFYSI